jgi:hypothetical protein
MIDGQSTTAVDCLARDAPRPVKTLMADVGFMGVAGTVAAVTLLRVGEDGEVNVV